MHWNLLFQLRRVSVTNGEKIIIKGLQETGGSKLTLQVTEKNNASLQSKECQIGVRKKAPTELTVFGVTFAVTPWKELQDCMKNGQPISQSNIYASTDEWGNPEYYVLEKDVQLTWNESYAKMTFEDFRKQSENSTKFIKVNTNWIPEWGEYYNPDCEKGQFYKKDDKYYICLKAGNWDTGEFCEIAKKQ